MNTIILDTLDFANKLKAGGFTDQQAETQARAIAEIVERQLVSRQDFELHQSDITRDIHESENKLELRIKEVEIKIKELETTLRKDIEILRAESKRDIAETKAELVRWVVGVGILQIAMITALLLRLANHI